jgi:hypothetical protein
MQNHHHYGTLCCVQMSLDDIIWLILFSFTRKNFFSLNWKRFKLSGMKMKLKASWKAVNWVYAIFNDFFVFVLALINRFQFYYFYGFHMKIFCLLIIANLIYFPTHCFPLLCSHCHRHSFWGVGGTNLVWKCNRLQLKPHHRTPNLEMKWKCEKHRWKMFANQQRSMTRLFR